MGNYEIGKVYKQGKYIGVVKLYPYGVNYYKLVHKFAKKPNDFDGRLSYIINEIEITRILL